MEPAPLLTNQQQGSELQTIEVEHAANGEARPIIDADKSEKYKSEKDKREKYKSEKYKSEKDKSEKQTGKKTANRLKKPRG